MQVEQMVGQRIRRPTKRRCIRPSRRGNTATHHRRSNGNRIRGLIWGYTFGSKNSAKGREMGATKNGKPATERVVPILLQVLPSSKHAHQSCAPSLDLPLRHRADLAPVSQTHRYVALNRSLMEVDPTCSFHIQTHFTLSYTPSFTSLLSGRPARFFYYSSQYPKSCVIRMVHTSYDVFFLSLGGQ